MVPRVPGGEEALAASEPVAARALAAAPGSGEPAPRVGAVARAGAAWAPVAAWELADVAVLAAASARAAVSARSVGAGGAGGAAATCNVPCIADVVKDCVPSGACTQQMVGASINICYANGVKMTVGITSLMAPITYTQAFRKADGSACYSVETAITPGGNPTLSWKNAAGTVIATGTVDQAMTKFTVMCGSQAYDLATSGCFTPPPVSGTPMAGSCTAGMCN